MTTGSVTFGSARLDARIVLPVVDDGHGWQAARGIGGHRRFALEGVEGTESAWLDDMELVEVPR